MNLTPCTTCDWYRRVSHAGADCDMHERLETLAHNLAVAAFGAAMFKAGDNFGFHMGSDESQCTCQWSPGHGEPYRGSTRCEQDEIYDESEADERYRAQRCSACSEELDLCCCPFDDGRSAL